MMYKIQTLNNISDVIHQSLTAELLSHCQGGARAGRHSGSLRLHA